MKCHPLRWIWGLLPVLLFSYLATLDIRDRVEADLTSRTERALHAANLGWAKVRFEGRDGILSGEAADEDEPGKAIQVATNVDGVRILDGQADLLKKVEPYTWQAAIHGRQVKLVGYVPNEPTHKKIVAAAKGLFPDSEIEDKMELARGNPPVGEWLEAVKFDLKQLTGMRHGHVELNGMQTSAHGEALSTQAYKQLRATFDTGLPKILRLGAANISPPAVDPYEWNATLDNNQLVLGGFVPSEQEQVEVLTHAKRTFGKTERCMEIRFMALSRNVSSVMDSGGFKRPRKTTMASVDAAPELRLKNSERTMSSEPLKPTCCSISENIESASARSIVSFGVPPI